MFWWGLFSRAFDLGCCWTLWLVTVLQGCGPVVPTGCLVPGCVSDTRMPPGCLVSPRIAPTTRGLVLLAISRSCPLLARAAEKHRDHLQPLFGAARGRCLWLQPPLTYIFPGMPLRGAHAHGGHPTLVCPWHGRVRPSVCLSIHHQGVMVVGRRRWGPCWAGGHAARGRKWGQKRGGGDNCSLSPG